MSTREKCLIAESESAEKEDKVNERDSEILTLNSFTRMRIKYDKNRHVSSGGGSITLKQDIRRSTLDSKLSCKVKWGNVLRTQGAPEPFFLPKSKGKRMLFLRENVCHRSKMIDPDTPCSSIELPMHMLNVVFLPSRSQTTEVYETWQSHRLKSFPGFGSK
jgi:hypothetical protein